LASHVRSSAPAVSPAVAAIFDSETRALNS